MPLERFRAEQFRCLESAELALEADYNLIHGANASGKTSLLEGVAYLGRGRSFRGAAVSNLVRHGHKRFALFGVVVQGGSRIKLGVGNSRDGLDIRIDGENGGVADLPGLLPLQVIDPNVHDLVAGGPDERRRFLDGVAFHVEHDFLPTWRQYRRALRQRNALLKGTGAGLSAWDAELGSLGERLDRLRRASLERAGPALEAHGTALVGQPVRFDYQPGWPEGESLESALAAARDRELAQGSTQVGPHRADLKLRVDDRLARRLVSRGQQKQLACAMVLAATDVVQRELGLSIVLLLDDPAAELDANGLERLMTRVFDLGSQVIATSLVPGLLSFPSGPAVFHVEHGTVTRES